MCLFVVIDVTVATAFGGHLGIDIVSPKQDILTMFKAAHAEAARGSAVLVNAHIGGSSFREGSISV